MRANMVLVMLLLLLSACARGAGTEPAVERGVDTAAAPVSPEPILTAALPTSPEPPGSSPPPTAPAVTDAPTPGVVPATETPPAPTAVAAAGFPGEPLPTDRGALFSGSGACSVCHTRMVDEAGTDVSVDSAWRATMMANAARDPYYQASVRAEVLSHPQHRELIEEKCATCHLPMAHFTQATLGRAAQVLDDGLLGPGHELQGLALDGVSCTLCHQIRAEGLGEPESLSGGFAIDAQLASGERELFGPFLVPPGQARMMQAASGFVPVQGLHVQRAAMCAACHTLYTPYVDGEGQVAGTFPEQMIYFEWQASTFGASIPCQGCHMPTAEGSVFLSITGGPPRSPVHQHTFAGGNAYMLRVFETFGQELGATASSLQFEEKQVQTLEQLEGRTATLELEQATVEGATLTVDVVVRSMAGHKFPSGFPSRRAWLHVTVRDAGGEVIFESGSPNPDGSIAGNDNDLDADSYEPHYHSIQSAEQVQIYEAIMGDLEGRPTTGLLSAASYLKDNRLPPIGFDKGSVADDIAVRGAALDDDDFGGGSDRVRYEIALGAAQGPYSVTAELLYQTIGYRWAQNLGAYRAPEPERFLRYYEQVPNHPVVIAGATTEVRR